jgi:hypothetical protein
MKMMSPALRLPLVELMSETKARIDAVLRQVGEGYSDYMIGHVGHDHHVRSFRRAPANRNFSVIS